MDDIWFWLYPEFNQSFTKSKIGTRGVWRVIDSFPSFYRYFEFSWSRVLLSELQVFSLFTSPFLLFIRTLRSSSEVFYWRVSIYALLLNVLTQYWLIFFSIMKSIYNIF